MSECINQTSLDTITGSLCEIMGVEPPQYAKTTCKILTEYADRVFDGKKADRVLMYNPDAIAQWVYQKYPQLCKAMTDRIDVEIPLASPMPTVTPVCFATMYTGAQPCDHGIQKYEKPVLAVETIFDALIKAGKRPAIVSHLTCTVAKIFLDRNMDYYPCKGVEEVHAKVAELIMEDTYDFIAVHACNYDTIMHKYGPESVEALSELRLNASAYASFDALVKRHWKDHNVFMGFAMDHGCHEIDGGCGSHGLDMPEDVNITHFYKAYAAEEAK